MDLKDYLGKRILTIEGNYSHNFNEFKVLEFSESGKYVQLMDINGRKIWKLFATLNIVEILPKKNKRRT